MNEELLLIDKPKGITSFDVIRRLRKELGIKKMGHAGTLDPLASGLMLVGIGKGTKQLATLIKLDKSYDAEIILGERRTTGDLEGDVVEAAAVTSIDTEKVEAALTRMTGILMLPVPVYSAIKQRGKALYARARKGEAVEAPVRAMEVKEATLLRIEEKGERVHVHVSFSVGSGTYIRSLAEEFGRHLGYPATLGNLRRTRIGTYTIDAARTV